TDASWPTARRRRSATTRRSSRRTWARTVPSRRWREAAMLSVDGLHAAYGRIQALHGVDVRVEQGEIVTLVGANGAGKTTLLRCLSGVHPVASGRIAFEGRDISRVAAHKRVGLGIAQSPEGRRI